MNLSRGTNNEKGFGMGFKICSDLLNLHGTSLEIESEINKGTAISFKLSK